MMDFLRKHQVQILWGVLAFFVLSIAMGFGSSFFVKGAPNDAVATVDNEAITVRQFMVHYNRSTAGMKPEALASKEARQVKVQEVLRDLIQGIVFKREAKAHGIVVPDRQVVNAIVSVPQFHNAKGEFDPNLYGQFLATQVRSTPAEFEEEQRQAIAFYKLRWLISSAIRVTDDELDRAYTERGAEFARVNAVIKEEKGSRRRSEAELRSLFRRQLQDEKAMYALNQWFNQIGAKLNVKPRLENLPGELR